MPIPTVCICIHGFTKYFHTHHSFNAARIWGPEWNACFPLVTLSQSFPHFSLAQVFWSLGCSLSHKLLFPEPIVGPCPPSDSPERPPGDAEADPELLQRRKEGADGERAVSETSHLPSASNLYSSLQLGPMVID